jgi:hypothetical protein
VPEQPKYGARRTMLYREGTKFRLVEETFTDQGSCTVYDEERLDWDQWNGSWHRVSMLGYFDSPEEARDFMLAAAEKAA